MTNKITFMKRIWYYIPSWNRIDMWFHSKKLSIKDVYQRITKGYADSESWSLDSSTAKWILPRLKHLRNNFYGMPPNLELYKTEKTKEYYSLTEDEWRDILDKIIYAFEFVLNEDDILTECYPKDYNWGFSVENTYLKWNDDRKPDYTYHTDCQKKYDEGMALFVLYFRHF